MTITAKFCFTVCFDLSNLVSILSSDHRAILLPILLSRFHWCFAHTLPAFHRSRGQQNLVSLLAAKILVSFGYLRQLKSLTGEEIKIEKLIRPALQLKSYPCSEWTQDDPLGGWRGSKVFDLLTVFIMLYQKAFIMMTPIKGGQPAPKLLSIHPSSFLKPNLLWVKKMRMRTLWSHLTLLSLPQRVGQDNTSKLN